MFIVNPTSFDNAIYVQLLISYGVQSNCICMIVEGILYCAWDPLGDMYYRWSTVSTSAQALLEEVWGNHLLIIEYANLLSAENNMVHIDAHLGLLKIVRVSDTAIAPMKNTGSFWRQLYWH